MNDSPRSTRLSGFDKDRLDAFIRDDLSQATLELVSMMVGPVDHSTTFEFHGQSSKARESSMFLKTRTSLLSHHHLAYQQH